MEFKLLDTLSYAVSSIAMALSLGTTLDSLTTAPSGCYYSALVDAIALSIGSSKSISQPKVQNKDIAYQPSSFVERLDTDGLGDISRHLQNQLTQSLTV